MMIFHRPFSSPSFSSASLVPSVFAAHVVDIIVVCNIFNTAPNCDYICEHQRRNKKSQELSTICSAEQRKEGRSISYSLPLSSQRNCRYICACGSASSAWATRCESTAVAQTRKLIKELRKSVCIYQDINAHTIVQTI